LIEKWLQAKCFIEASGWIGRWQLRKWSVAVSAIWALHNQSIDKAPIHLAFRFAADHYQNEGVLVY
jgi:hypothetical protein